MCQGCLLAGIPDDAPEEETRKLRAEALKCLRRSILTATIVNVVPSGRRIIMSERPPKNLSDNPSQQELDARHLAVLQQNLGEVVEVTSPSVCRHDWFHSHQTCVQTVLPSVRPACKPALKPPTNPSVPTPPPNLLPSNLLSNPPAYGPSSNLPLNLHAPCSCGSPVCVSWSGSNSQR